MLRAVLLGLVVVSSACGPSAGSNDECPGADLDTDESNCGACGNHCAAAEACVSGRCALDCSPGQVDECYSGPGGTKGVGPCRSGTRTCSDDGSWGACVGEVTPAVESCTNGVDDNCSGEADENVDQDGDGFSTCEGDCCDSTALCTAPELVNPGAFDAQGNFLDDDCDSLVDNDLICDDGIPSDTGDALDYARAIDICRATTESERRWGILDAVLTLPDGSGAPAAAARSVRGDFGTNIVPQAGVRLAVLSSGHAADRNDTSPSYSTFSGTPMGTSSGFPGDWLSAHGGSLPNAPGCPPPDGTTAFDPVMLTVRLRVPTNANSFSISSYFFSAEYPEYVCSPFNDFFVILLDSEWAGDPANPSDKNLATYTAPSGDKYPVGVNLAHGNTGLFSQCVNGDTGCTVGVPGSISTCTGTDELLATGFDVATPLRCDGNSLEGGGTGWLETSGNVISGEIITLRIAIWDTSDDILDSLALIDHFRWSVGVSAPGTVVD